MKTIIKDLPNQLIGALISPMTLNEVWTPLQLESFMESDLSYVKKRLIEKNNGEDSFDVINKTDGVYASHSENTFDKQIEFITNFHKRYSSQAGMYRDNKRELIDARNVVLCMWPHNVPLTAKDLIL